MSVITATTINHVIDEVRRSDIHRVMSYVRDKCGKARVSTISTSILLHDVPRTAFDTIDAAEERLEYSDLRPYWQRSVRVGEFTMHFFTNEPPIG